MSENSIFSTEIRVLVNHLNYGNHLGYDSVLSILQEARMRWLKSLNNELSETSIDGNVGWLVKDVNVSYKSEAHHGDLLKVTIYSSDRSRMGFKMVYAVDNLSTQKNVCDASTNLIFFDFIKSKVSRVPNVIALELDKVIA